MFRLILPSKLYEALDFSRLKAYIGEAAFKGLGELRSDILFTVPPFGEDWLVYLYFEHSSGDNKRKLIAEIRNKAGAIENLKLETDPGCQVISTLLYQPKDPEKSWYYRRRPREINKSTSDIHDILEGFGLSDGLYVLDLALVNVDELDTCLTMRAVLYTLKYIRHDDFEDKVPKIAKWLEEEKELDVIKLLGEYIVEYLKVSMKEIDRLIEKLSETKLGVETMYAKEAIMNYGYAQGMRKGAKKAMKKGIAIGIEQGIEQREEEKLQTAANLLQHGVLLEIVLKSTGLTKKQLREAGFLDK